MASALWLHPQDCQRLFVQSQNVNSAFFLLTTQWAESEELYLLDKKRTQFHLFCGLSIPKTRNSVLTRARLGPESLRMCHPRFQRIMSPRMHNSWGWPIISHMAFKAWFKTEKLIFNSLFWSSGMVFNHTLNTSFTHCIVQWLKNKKWSLLVLY